jgi:mRNA interferase RelE/StbE
MKYSIVFEKNAEKQLSELGVTQQRIIINWISENLGNAENPRVHGTALKGKKEYWRYKIGDYRLIADIKGMGIYLITIERGNRKSIYSG